MNTLALVAEVIGKCCRRVVGRMICAFRGGGRFSAGVKLLLGILSVPGFSPEPHVPDAPFARATGP